MDANTAMATLADYVIVLGAFAILGSLAGQAIGAFVCFIVKKAKAAWDRHKEKKLPGNQAAE